MNGMVDKNYSVMFLDVDNLKQINDNYGHDVGDKVLIEVANVIKKNVRKSDLVMRYGGDEFVVVMWDCDLKSAKRTAEKLLTEIGNIRINDQVKISVSIGLSKGMDSLEKSIMMADRCMLEAKKLGKNGIKSDFQ
ncbi:MAG TPA: GGDEF domain-containing protein [Thermotogales bacterium]|nr:GGDEF domain-containing protein [Thermotogales bacterium]